MKSTLTKYDLYFLKNSSFDQINLNKEKKATKKRRRKTVETSTTTISDSILCNFTDVNKIRLSKSDDTFDLKLQNSDKISFSTTNSHQILNTTDQLVPNNNCCDNNDDELEFENFNQLKLYIQIEV